MFQTSRRNHNTIKGNVNSFKTEKCMRQNRNVRTVKCPSNLGRRKLYVADNRRHLLLLQKDSSYIMAFSSLSRSKHDSMFGVVRWRYCHSCCTEQALESRIRTLWVGTCALHLQKLVNAVHLSHLLCFCDIQLSLSVTSPMKLPRSRENQCLPES